MINNTTVENKYTTTGNIDTVYPITFEGATDANGLPLLKVVLTDTEGVATELVYNVDYALVYDDVQDDNTESLNTPHLSGISLLTAEVAAAGNSLDIVRTTPFVQPVDFQVGRIDPEQIERSFDLSVLRDQEIKNQLGKDEVVIENHETRITTAEDDIDAIDDTLSGHLNNTSNPHNTNVGNLTDVTLSSLQARQFLMFDGVKWVNVNYSATCSWGGIVGDITDQADLMAEFDKKLNLSGGTLTGDLAFQYNTSYPVLRIIQSGQNTNHLRFINNSYASQSISFDLSQAAIHPLVTGRGHLGTSDIHFGDAHIDKVYAGFINNGYDIAIPVTASADTFALVDKDINPLQQQVNHLQTIGRFLSFWDATTGLAQTNPQTSPYIYKTGDYFRVGVVASGGGTNYKPTGSSYTIGVASTVVETERLTVGQVYYYDGTNWALAAGGNVAIDGTTIVFNNDNELQAVATVNQNTAAGATNPVFDWVGTLAQYQAQNIETLHPDWLCYITDDVGGGESVYTKSQVDSLLALKVSTGHEVIEFQAPTAANNYTWYRLYADGWVEQGGVVVYDPNPTTINFPITMADTNYTATAIHQRNANLGAVWTQINTKSTTSFVVGGYYNEGQAGSADSGRRINWQVCGMAA